MTIQTLGSNIFLSHFGQLMLLLLWISGNLFHIASEGNYSMWTSNPLRIRPIAHIQLDPHFGNNASVAFSRGGTNTSVNNSIVIAMGTLFWSAHLFHQEGIILCGLLIR